MKNKIKIKSVMQKLKKKLGGGKMPYKGLLKMYRRQYFICVTSRRARHCPGSVNNNLKQN